MTQDGDPFRVVERIGDAHLLAGPTPFDATGTSAAIGAIELDGARRIVEVLQLAEKDRSELDALLYDAQHAPKRAPRVWLSRGHEAWRRFVVERFPGVRLADVLASARDGRLPVVACAWIAHEVAHTLRCGGRSADGVLRPLQRFGDDFAITWAGDVVLQPSRLSWFHEQRTPWDIAERIRGRPWQPSTGSHVVAHVLWSLIEGGHPWPDMSSQLATLESVRIGEALPLTRGDVPESLRAMVESGLRKDPAQRPTILRVAELLDQVVGELGGDQRDYVAGFMANVFPLERAQQLAFLEQLQAAPLHA